MANIGGRAAGTITAAGFLSQFTKKYRLGAPRHRRHRLPLGQGKGLDRPPGATADAFPDRSRGERQVVTRIQFLHGAPDRLAAAAAGCAKPGSGASRSGLRPSHRGRRSTRSPAVDTTGDRIRPPLQRRLVAGRGNTDRACARDLDQLAHDGCLVNLADELPPGFSRFEELVEIVSTDDEDRLPARERFRFYRERGYSLDARDISGGLLSMADDDNPVSNAGAPGGSASSREARDRRARPPQPPPRRHRSCARAGIEDIPVLTEVFVAAKPDGRRGTPAPPEPPEPETPAAPPEPPRPTRATEIRRR